ncbi:MAG: response regulator transcription factor [Actinomycetota bacterium]|nr:response regulator transcription factor [Actinomycetota bacterium]
MTSEISDDHDASPPRGAVLGGQRTRSSAPIRVLLIDDHTLVREGTAELLGREPELDVLGQAGTAAEGLGLLGRLRPDVALIDVNLPDRNGLALAKEAAARYPEVRILILSAYDDYAYLAEALELRVGGYLLKTASARELVDAVRAVADGVFVLTPALSTRLARRLRHDRPTPPGGALSARESEVLASLALGRSNKEIAASLHLGLRTVETHVSSLLAKLGVSSRAEAVYYSLSHHLVAPGDDGEPSVTP